jgi:cell division ATPase FtsA
MKKTSRKGRRTPSCFCVVDPGTTTLRVLVAEVQGGRATVWGWAEAPAMTGPDLNVQPLAFASEGALSQAEGMAQGRAGRWLMADQMVVGLPVSQLQGWAPSVTQRRAQPERPIDERELAGLLGRALRLAVGRIGTGDGGDTAWQLVDSVVVALSVDNHGVTDPVGFKGRDFGATVFTAATQSDLIDTWCEVARRLEFSALTLAGAPQAIAAGLAEPQLILIDVGGRTTDLICCQAGRPVAIESLSTGGTGLARTLIQKWGMTPDRAEQLKRAYGDGRLAGEAAIQVKQVLAPAVQAWLAETETALARLNQDGPLPHRLVLLGGGSLVPDIADALRTLAWSQRLHFARHPEVGHLRPTDLPGVVNRTDLGRAGGDVAALALAAWAARQTEPPDRPARLLSELCRGEQRF